MLERIYLKSLRELAVKGIHVGKCRERVEIMINRRMMSGRMISKRNMRRVK